MTSEEIQEKKFALFLKQQAEKQSALERNERRVQNALMAGQDRQTALAWSGFLESHPADSPQCALFYDCPNNRRLLEEELKKYTPEITQTGLERSFQTIRIKLEPEPVKPPVAAWSYGRRFLEEF
jgi:hypothetical protein